MTIEVYEGVPGSGKGIHATERGIIGMNRPGGVIANWPVVRPRHRKDGSSRWLYVPTYDMTPEVFMDHAERYHVEGKEHQGLIMIDECHRLLNSRTTWTGRRELAGRQAALVQYLAEHRHWGWDVILVIQSMKMLDKQVREALVEQRVKHFKWNSFWFLRWCPVPVFGRVSYNAQFAGMKGRLSFSLGLMAYGRYDHLGVRKMERERLRKALAPAPLTVLPGDPGHDNSGAAAEQLR